MDGEKGEPAQESPAMACSHGVGIGISASQRGSKAEPAFTRSYLSLHEPISKPKGFHGSNHLDLKLRHTRVSFVKIGHHTSDEGTISTEEAETKMSGPSKKPSFGQTSIQGPSFGNLGVQNSSSRISTSSECKTTGNDLTQPRKHNEHVIHHEVVKPQGTILASFGSLPPHRDHLPERGVRRRSPSSLSNSSEEIIIFRGRSQANAKTSSTTNRSTSCVENSENILGFVGLTKPDRLVDPPSTKHERTSKSSRSISPEAASLGETSLTKQSADSTKQGRSIPDKSSPIGLRRNRYSRSPRKYGILADHIANTDKIEDNGSAIDRFSDVSDDSSTDGTGFEFSSVELMAYIRGAPGVENSHDDDHRVLLKKNLPSELTHISTQQDPQSKFYENAEINQDLIGKGQIQLETPENFDNMSTEQKMRNLRIETMAQMPVSETRVDLLDQGLEFVPLATDDEDETHEHDDPLLPSMALLHPRVLSKAGNVRNFKKYRSSPAVFLDEADFLDYGEFDIMDRQRPSIQSRGNTRSRHLNAEPPDIVFENRMQLAWEGDRAKKKLRKQARADLRQLGLLDKKGKVSLRSKYAQGLSLGDIEEKFKILLQSSQESLVLPPMDHKSRRLVHEIANNLTLRSKSIGKGNNRFPILYKTSRTGSFDAGALNAIISRVGSGRYLSKKDKLGGSGSNVSRRRFGGGFNHAAVSYHDGEIVGAAAPELGEDNKGRAMLERMGWSTGTALGALNNKGIMKPVAHVVKTTKAGLG